MAVILSIKCGQCKIFDPNYKSTFRNYFSPNSCFTVKNNSVILWALVLELRFLREKVGFFSGHPENGIGTKTSLKVYLVRIM